MKKKEIYFFLQFLFFLPMQKKVNLLFFALLFFAISFFSSNAKKGKFLLFFALLFFAIEHSRRGVSDHLIIERQFPWWLLRK